ncbi:hypothetical protein RSAG8_10487, partial [Rhizoctonia solani AG-8 WAC10335]
MKQFGNPFGPLGVAVVGIVRSVDGDNQTLSTETYNRCHRTRLPFDVAVQRPENGARFQHLPTPTIGSVLLARGVLSHFDANGRAVVLLEVVTTFSVTPHDDHVRAAAAPSPGRGKGEGKSELTANVTPKPKKTKPEPAPFVATNGNSP